jgi:Transposase
VGWVIIGVDPHKRSATIEVIDERETVLARGRLGTDSDGYRTMLALGRRFGQRVWAVEGCNGIGRHVAQRLVVDGETVLDVPAKLSARARVFATGQGRKTDPVDAHSVAVAVAALRAKGLRQVAVDDATVALRLLADRRDRLGRAAPRPSAGCTPCCWNSSRAGRRSTCPPRRPARCSTPSTRGTSSAVPDGSWPPSRSPNSPPSTRRSRPPIGS